MGKGKKINKNKKRSSSNGEEQIVRKLEILYKKAVKKLVNEYKLDKNEASMAVLSKGSLFGQDKDILTNILNNSLEHLDDNDGDDDHDYKPLLIFKDLTSLARHSMQNLINETLQQYPKLNKNKAISFLLESIDNPNASSTSSSSSVPVSAAMDIDLGKILMKANFSFNDEFYRVLVETVKEFEEKLEENREWSRKTVILVAKKVAESTKELQDSRFDPKKRDKEKNEGDTIVANIEDELLIRERKEFMSELNGWDLSLGETLKSIDEAKKKERKMMNKCKNGENINQYMKRKIQEEKEKIEEMEKRQQEVHQEIHQLEVKLRQTKEGKVQARNQLGQEKILQRLQRENSKNKLTALRHELNIKFQESMDEQRRLEDELSKLKAQISSSSSSSSSSSCSSSSAAGAATVDQYQFKNRRSKPCMICKKNDVSIVFLPCFHQVICSACHDEVYNVLGGFCPCCNTSIQKAVKVIGRD